jgi:hypothetical protein
LIQGLRVTAESFSVYETGSQRRDVTGNVVRLFLSFAVNAMGGSMDQMQTAVNSMRVDKFTGEILPDQEVLVAEATGRQAYAVYLGAGVLLLVWVFLETVEYFMEKYLFMALGISTVTASHIALVLGVVGVVLFVQMGVHTLYHMAQDKT